MILRTGGHRCLIEIIYLRVALGLEPPVDRPWIGRTLFQPKAGPLPVTESPKIKMAILTLVGYEEPDFDGLQCRFVKCQRPLDVGCRQNDVIQHCSLLHIESNSIGFSPSEIVRSRIRLMVCSSCSTSGMPCRNASSGMDGGLTSVIM